MTQENNYLYSCVEDSGFTYLKILYKQQGFRLLIILPNDRFGVNEVKIRRVKAIENLEDYKNFQSRSY